MASIVGGRAAQADVLFDMGLQSLLDEAEPNGNDDWRRRP